MVFFRLCSVSISTCSGDLGLNLDQNFKSDDSTSISMNNSSISLAMSQEAQQQSDTVQQGALAEEKPKTWIEPIYEPVDGIVQPITIPPEEKPHRNTNQLQYLLKIINKSLLKHGYIWPFREPVNSIELNIPDYHTIVKHPMDLNTIKKRLENYFYYSAEECINDFRLMFKNCYLYNKPDEDVVFMAKTIEDALNAKLKELPKPEIELEIKCKNKGKKGKKRGRGKNQLICFS